MKIAYLFSGQGAQHPGMMKDLYDKIPEVKQVFRTANQVLNRDIASLCFEGSDEELSLTHNTQPCVLAADLAAYVAASSCGIIPNAVAGFSLGEYAALVASKVITIDDAFRVIQLRADAMQEAVPIGHGGMLAVIGSSEQDILEICEQVKSGFVALANLNCPGQIVISGDIEGIKNFREITDRNSIKTISLSVSAPFHYKMMEPAAQKLRKIFPYINFSDSKYPIFMNVDAQSTFDHEEIMEKVILQTTSPVYWEKTILNMISIGIDTFVELGPGKTLSSFVKKTVKNVMICRISDYKTLYKTIEITK